MIYYRTRLYANSENVRMYYAGVTELLIPTIFGAMISPRTEPALGEANVTTNGSKVRNLAALDEYSRECLALASARSASTRDVLLLDWLFLSDPDPLIVTGTDNEGTPWFIMITSVQ